MIGVKFDDPKYTSTKVLQSLPGGVWEAYGASGWGPNGNYAFMEFDYGGVVGAGQDNTRVPFDQGNGWYLNETIPRHASALFEQTSCAWTKYYASEEILEAVGRLYSSDFAAYRWYDLNGWRRRLKACLQSS